MRIGIDPGNTGAIVLLDDRAMDLIAVHDMPTMARPVGKGLTVDPQGLLETLNLMKKLAGRRTIEVHLEAVSAMRKPKPKASHGPGKKAASDGIQGVTSAFNFGYGAGMCHAMVVACGLEIKFVNPRTWKSAAGLTGQPKGASRDLVKKLFTQFEETFKRVKDVGRADAVLIALHEPRIQLK